MKIYPFLFAVVFASAQTTPPKPAAPSQSAPSAQTTNPAEPGKPATPSLAPLADPNRVVATIGDYKMTAAQFESIVDTLPPQYKAQALGAAKRQFMEQLVQIKLLANKAKEMHLDQLPGTQAQIAFAGENILAQQAGKAFVESAKVDDETLHKYYDDHKGEFQSAAAHHILIRFKGSPVPVKDGQKDMTEEEALAKAQEIEKRLKAGEDFAAIAKAESADAGSGANGGDLGTFRHGQMVKPFEDAAFSMKPGQISDPVKSQFGYHIIKLDKIESKSFDEAKGEIEGKLKPEMARKRLDDIRKSAEVKLDDGYFGPAPAAPAPQAAVTPPPAPAAK